MPDTMEAGSVTYELIALDSDGHEQGRYPVATLPFKPGDVLVVQVRGIPPQAEVERLRAKLYELFSIDRVLIVTDDVRFLRLEAMDG